MSKKTIEDLEKEIDKIKSRNKKVEAEKAWETSIERKVSILILTYVIISLVMLLLDFDKPFLNAIIPTFGFLLSTLSISFLKKRYVERYINKRG
ncbi:MAG: hypothetical protein WC850_00840 [Candidatus Gracilibacteria bacterium]